MINDIIVSVWLWKIRFFKHSSCLHHFLYLSDVREILAVSPAVRDILAVSPAVREILAVSPAVREILAVSPTVRELN